MRTPRAAEASATADGAVDHRAAHPDDNENLLVQTDAIHLADFVATGSADLAYLDPPFKVEKSFGARLERGSSRARGPIAYDDTWPSLESYLSWLEERIGAGDSESAPDSSFCRLENVFE